MVEGWLAHRKSVKKIYYSVTSWIRVQPKFWVGMQVECGREIGKERKKWILIFLLLLY